MYAKLNDNGCLLVTAEEKEAYRLWHEDLTPAQKRRLSELQWDLLESGYAKDEQFVAYECHARAVELLKAEIASGVQNGKSRVDTAVAAAA